MNERVIVTGGRAYADRQRVYNVLDALHWSRVIAALAHGDAPGADQLAKEWALDRGVRVIPYPAYWNTYGKAAGPLRNIRMARMFAPTLVVAFPGGDGTKNMIETAHRLGITVQEVSKM